MSAVPRPSMARPSPADTLDAAKKVPDLDHVIVAHSGGVMERGHAAIVLVVQGAQDCHGDPI